MSHQQRKHAPCLTQRAPMGSITLQHSPTSRLARRCGGTGPDGSLLRGVGGGEYCCEENPRVSECTGYELWRWRESTNDELVKFANGHFPRGGSKVGFGYTPFLVVSKPPRLTGHPRPFNGTTHCLKRHVSTIPTSAVLVRASRGWSNNVCTA